MSKTKIAIGAAILVLIGVAGLIIRHEQQPKNAEQQPGQPQPVRDIAGVPEKPGYHFTPQQSMFFRERLNFGKKVGFALQTIAKENGGQLPPDLTSVASWLATNKVPNSGVNESKAGIGVANFELVYKGDLSDLKNPSQTILAREKEPIEIHEGRWNRMYVFADGSVNRLEATTADGFPAREKEVWPNQP